MQIITIAETIPDHAGLAAGKTIIYIVPSRKQRADRKKKILCGICMAFNEY